MLRGRIDPTPRRCVVSLGGAMIMSQACDRFFRSRGMVSEGMAGIMRQDIVAARNRGRRESKAELIAAEIENSWPD